MRSATVAGRHRQTGLCRIPPNNRLRGQVAATAAAGAPVSSSYVIPGGASGTARKASSGWLLGQPSRSTARAPLQRGERRPRATTPPLLQPRTRTLSFFALAPRTLNPVISYRWRAPGFWPVCARPCYLLLGPVTRGVTGKSLLRHGFRGLLPVTPQSVPYDVRASASARAPVSLSFYGNIGNNKEYSLGSKACALLSLLPAALGAGTSVTSRGAAAGAAASRNKIGGGYSVGRRRSSDLHRPAGDGRRNFPASRAIGAGREMAGLVDQARIRSGGFLPFLRGGAAAVGRVALEGSGQGLGSPAFSGAGRKLSRLARRPDGGRLAPPIGRGGVAPPFAPPRLRSTLRLDVFRISDSLPATPSRDCVQARPERALSSSARTGLGVSGFGRADFGPGAARGTFKAGERVGDERAASGLSGRPVGAVKLHRGGAHVNG